MATPEVANVAGADQTSTQDQQQAFEQAAENARIQQIVGQAIGSLASTQLMEYAGDMLKDEG